MSIKHVMLDTETLSTTSRAVVLEIGWALFDPNGQGVDLSGSVLLDVQEQIDVGREVDFNTLLWWSEQEPRVRNAVLAKDGRVPVCRALVELGKVYLDACPVTATWSHGACFDVPLLESPYKQFHCPVPWNFREVRDTRTIFSLADVNLAYVDGDKHRAKTDAVAQALTVQAAYANLGRTAK